MRPNYQPAMDAASVRRDVMRSRSAPVIIFIVVGLLAAAVLINVLAPAPSQCNLSIGVLQYQYLSPAGITVYVGITNTGNSTIRYNRTAFSEAQVREQFPWGWRRGSNRPISLVPGTPELLKPGAHTEALVALHRDMVRWQVIYSIRSASLRDRILARLPAKWRSYASPILGRVLSGKEGPDTEVQSNVFTAN